MMPVSVVSPAAKNRTIIVLVGRGVCQWSAWSHLTQNTYVKFCRIILKFRQRLVGSAKALPALGVYRGDFGMDV